MGSAGDEEWLHAWDSQKGKAGNNNRNKQAGLYVDFDVQASTVNVPAELFTEGQATLLVEMVESVVGPWTHRAMGDLTRLLTPDPRVHALLAEARVMKANSGDGEVTADVAMALLEKYFEDGGHASEVK